MKEYAAGPFRLTLDTSVFDAEQRKMLREVKNCRPPLTRFLSEFALDVSRKWNEATFSRLWNAPFNFRNAAIWRPVKAQYTRKDGTRVPPWGMARSYRNSDISKRGVLRGSRGSVKGKLRPSHTRVKPTSIVGKDTKEMAREFTGPPTFSQDTRTGTLSAMRPYAARQNRLRPFNRFSNHDRQRFRYWVTDWLNKLIQARNARASR